MTSHPTGHRYVLERSSMTSNRFADHVVCLFSRVFLFFSSCISSLLMSSGKSFIQPLKRLDIPLQRSSVRFV